MKYCWFKTQKDLIEDHKGIKEMIKKRELQIDKLGWVFLLKHTEKDIEAVAEELEAMSHEMMSINM